MRAVARPSKIGLTIQKDRKMTNNPDSDAAGQRTSFLGWVRRNWGKVAALGVIAITIVWIARPEGEELPPPPTTAGVMRGDIENTVAASATLQAGSMVDVGVRVTGQLTKLHVKLGDEVAKGDLLAEIDDFIQQTRVASAQANLEQLLVNTASQEASLELSRGELRRQERLMKESATTKVEYDRVALPPRRSSA